ncbi:MAG: ATP12 family chaperone protein [Pararhodobacter sp.]
MTGWARKVFWKDVTVQAGPGGHAVLLDGRPLRTPARAPLVLPTLALADMVATEWRAQAGTIRPDSMPATRAANAAIDKVRVSQAEVAALVSAYGETDLLCYRARSPVGLCAAQAATWDPLLDWAAQRYGVTWLRVEGVMPANQPAATLSMLQNEVARLSPFQLTAMHDLVAMSGSLVIGLAVLESADTPERLWQASRIDEDWQARHWGQDEDAQQTEANRRETFMQAERFLNACRASDR